jgi:hypothetical protein
MKELLTSNYSKYYLSGQKDKHSINYSFNKASKLGNIGLLSAQENRLKIINNFFSSLNKVVYSDPVFRISMDKVVISFSYYREPLTVTRVRDKNSKVENDYKERFLNPNTINNLGHLLSKIFGRPVELRIIKLKYPYLDRTILAKYCRMLQRIVPFHIFMKWVFNTAPVFRDKQSKDKEQIKKDREAYKNYPFQSRILGIKIQLSGRFESEQARPKQKPVSKIFGAFKNEPDRLVDYGTCTGHNSNGSYTVKVWINQKLFDKKKTRIK